MIMLRFFAYSKPFFSKRNGSGLCMETDRSKIGHEAIRIPKRQFVAFSAAKSLNFCREI
jgi:hypothetical protein